MSINNSKKINLKRNGLLKTLQNTKKSNIIHKGNLDIL